MNTFVAPWLHFCLFFFYLDLHQKAHPIVSQLLWSLMQSLWKKILVAQSTVVVITIKTTTAAEAATTAVLVVAAAAATIIITAQPQAVEAAVVTTTIAAAIIVRVCSPEDGQHGIEITWIDPSFIMLSNCLEDMVSTPLVLLLFNTKF